MVIINEYILLHQNFYYSELKIKKKKEEYKLFTAFALFVFHVRARVYTHALYKQNAQLGQISR